MGHGRSDFGRQVALFVTNVLNGTVAAGGSHVDGGTVVRIVLTLHRTRAHPSARSR